MANSWSIKIINLPDGTVAFQPDLPGAQPGQPLGADNGDNVTWNNRTNAAHWPHESGNPLTENIPPGKVSNPIFIVTGNLAYSCMHHPGEQGSIVTDVTNLVGAVALATSKKKDKKKEKRRKKNKNRADRGR